MQFTRLVSLSSLSEGLFIPVESSSVMNLHLIVCSNHNKSGMFVCGPFVLKADIVSSANGIGSVI
jgi:hypothetical protein